MLKHRWIVSLIVLSLLSFSLAGTNSATAPAASAPAVGLAAISLYVSPGGNDAWSGRLSDPNSAGTDGPLATVQKARDLLRAILAQRGAGASASICAAARIS